MRCSTSSSTAGLRNFTKDHCELSALKYRDNLRATCLGAGQPAAGAAVLPRGLSFQIDRRTSALDSHPYAWHSNGTSLPPLSKEIRSHEHFSLEHLLEERPRSHWRNNDIPYHLANQWILPGSRALGWQVWIWVGYLVLGNPLSGNSQRKDIRRTSNLGDCRIWDKLTTGPINQGTHTADAWSSRAISSIDQINSETPQHYFDSFLRYHSNSCRDSFEADQVSVGCLVLPNIGLQVGTAMQGQFELHTIRVRQRKPEGNVSNGQNLRIFGSPSRDTGGKALVSQVSGSWWGPGLHQSVLLLLRALVTSGVRLSSQRSQAWRLPLSVDSGAISGIRIWSASSEFERGFGYYGRSPYERLSSCNTGCSLAHNSNRRPYKPNIITREDTDWRSQIRWSEIDINVWGLFAVETFIKLGVEIEHGGP